MSQNKKMFNLTFFLNPGKTKQSKIKQILTFAGSLWNKHSQSPLSRLEARS